MTSKCTTSSVQSLSRVWLFGTPWTAAHQASLFITNSWSLLKLMSIESNHFVLCCPLLLLPSIFPSIRVFSHESALHLHIRWPKYWYFGVCPLSKAKWPEEKLNHNTYVSCFSNCWKCIQVYSLTISWSKSARAASRCCCCSVSQSCLTLWDPMDCSTLGFPVHHQLLELA